MNIDQEKGRFFKKALTVLDTFYTNVDDFMIRVARQEPYEHLLYSWINSSYQEGKSIEETIRIVHQIRNLTFFNPPPKPNVILIITNCKEDKTPLFFDFLWQYACNTIKNIPNYD